MPTNLQPFHQIVAQNLVSPLVDRMSELYAIAQKESQGNKEILNILKQLKDGKIPLDRIFVTDDGVKILPEAPDKDKAKALLPTTVVGMGNNKKPKQEAKDAVPVKS